MDPSRFKSADAGRAVLTETGYHAFLPAPLPPQIEWDDELVRALSKADSALSELSGISSQLPNPHLLIDPYVRQEAVLSSKIEGTQASLSDLYIDEIDPRRVEASRDDIHEVRNYVRALDFGLARLKELPLSLRLVREIHGQLMDGVRGGHATPGEFRVTQNWIGRPGSTLMTADYVPPPPDEMLDALGAWETYLHARETTPDLVQCALVHEQFEAIHPFLDGNGRIGRLLITLFLVERGRLRQPLLYLSAYFEANRDHYYEALQRARTDGDWRGWLLYFLTGVQQVADRATKQAADLTDLREEYRSRLGSKTTALALAEHVFAVPYVTAASAAEALGVTDPTARAAIRALEGVGLLFEATGRPWGKLWEARPVVEVLERPL